ncbi:MAG TPA: amidohydrolase [Bryobacteraceae bacterium]|nr:amidohydrolase [Bryobacteraceae bacterium]
MDTRLIAATLLAAGLLPAAEADLILHHGKIVTVDAAFSVREAVAIKGNRVVRVGSDRDVLAAERGPHTRMVDLKGRVVLPGLIDSHLHPLEAALSEYRRPLPALDSIASVQRYLRERMAKTPKGQWIVVPRTFPTRLRELRMPTRMDLDVATEHPVMFDASYVVILNSYALRLCGIDRNTPAPPRGEIVRDETGEPNGILKNAHSLVKGLESAEPFSTQDKLQALRGMLERYAAAGLTAVGDGAVDDPELYRALRKDGGLPVRAVLTWWMDISKPTDELERNIRAASYTTGTGDDWIKFGALKVNYDGGMTIGTAYQRQPYGPFGRQLYGKTDPADRGQFFAAPEKYLAVFRAAREKGWQVSAHTQGGGAIDAFLDTMEALDKDRPLAPERPHWIHASFQSPDALRRARRLGVRADVQAAWLYRDGTALEKVFGQDGMRYFFPLHSYIEAGIHVAGGSDHMIGWDKNSAVNPYNPFLGLWTAVTRKTDRGAVIHAEERIGREDALRMYTIWAAERMFAEKALGSIETGKLADLVVIDRDYLTCPEDDIARIEPVMTVLDGKLVRSHAGAASQH